MWDSPFGYRILCGNEASLYKEATKAVVQSMDLMRDNYSSSVNIFDGLTRNQQIYCLHKSLQYLLTSEECLRPTAFIDGTIAVVFSELFLQYLLETENVPTDRNKNFWRNLIIKTCSDNGIRISYNDADIEWSNAVILLKDLVLWDEDYDLELMDLNAQSKANVFKSLGIDENYFTDIPDDPSDEETEKLKRYILSIS